MKKGDLISAKPNIEKLIEEMEKNLDKRIAQERLVPAKVITKK